MTKCILQVTCQISYSSGLWSLRARLWHVHFGKSASSHLWHSCVVAEIQGSSSSSRAFAQFFVFRYGSSCSGLAVLELLFSCIVKQC